MFAKAQSPMEERMLRAPRHPAWLYTDAAPNKTIFHNNEWGEGWHEMIDKLSDIHLTMIMYYS